MTAITNYEQLESKVAHLNKSLLKSPERSHAYHSASKEFKSICKSLKNALNSPESPRAGNLFETTDGETANGVFDSGYPYPHNSFFFETHQDSYTSTRGRFKW